MAIFTQTLALITQQVKSLYISPLIILLFSCNSNSEPAYTSDPYDHRNYDVSLEKECDSLDEGRSQIEIEMVLVPGGNFNFGCQHQDSLKCDPSSVSPYPEFVFYDYIDSFYISKHEITYSQFKSFVDESGYQTDAEINGEAYVWEIHNETDGLEISTPNMSWKFNEYKNPMKPCDKNMPVSYISYRDATEFCKWYSNKTGKNCYVPLRQQWEYAARGGQLTNDYKYSGSDELNLVSWNGDNSNKLIHPVGLLDSNELGLYDMSGNVREWVRDSTHSPRELSAGMAYLSTNQTVIYSFNTARIFEGCSDQGFRIAMSKN